MSVTCGNAPDTAGAPGTRRTRSDPRCSAGVCRGAAARAIVDAWLPSKQLLVLRDGAILRFAPGSKPRKIARGINDFSFVTNPTGTRIAVGRGSPSCLSCSGPVTILNALSGTVIGKVGGRKLDNLNPTLSPDGTKVVFERIASDDSGETFGIWTAKTNGSHP